MADQSSKKRLFSKLTLEFSYQLTIQIGKCQKPKGKLVTDKMCQLIFLKNIFTAIKTMTQESFTYLLGMSSYKFNFIFKTSQYP